MSEDKEGTFSNEKVDKIVFRPLSLDMDARVKNISDPPPRPIPPALDDRDAESWTPAARQAKGKEIFESMQKVGNVLKYVLFSTLALASMAGIGWVIFWLIDEYGLGV